MTISDNNLNYGIMLGFKLARLEFLWGSSFDFAQAEFVNAKKDILSYVASDHIIPDEESYQSFSSSIVNFYFRSYPEIFYSLLIGICMQRAYLVGASKNNAHNIEMETLARSSLENLPNALIQDKDDFFHFIKRIATSDSFGTQIQKIGEYINRTAINTQTITSADGRNGYVFISYSSRNQQYAEATRSLLQEEAIPHWMAPYDIPAGSKYAHVINDAIEKCSCVLLLLSAEAQASEFVEREIERAVTYKKPIISMHLDRSSLNSGFRYLIGNSQIIPVNNIHKKHYEVDKILNGIRALISRTPTTRNTDSNGDLRSRFCQFISGISLSRYCAVKAYFESGKDIHVDGGIFSLCKKILALPHIDDDGKAEFHTIMLVSKTIYYLAKEMQYDDICLLMSSISRKKYMDASVDVKEYMLKEVDSLEGDFIEYLFQSLSESSEDRFYLEKLLKEMFVWLRACTLS